jgi:hypothetical protein
MEGNQDAARCKQSGGRHIKSLDRDCLQSRPDMEKVKRVGTRRAQEQLFQSYPILDQDIPLGDGFSDPLRLPPRPPTGFGDGGFYASCSCARLQTGAVPLSEHPGSMLMIAKRGIFPWTVSPCHRSKQSARQHLPGKDGP